MSSIGVDEVEEEDMLVRERIMDLDLKNPRWDISWNYVIVVISEIRYRWRV